MFLPAPAKRKLRSTAALGAGLCLLALPLSPAAAAADPDAERLRALFDGALSAFEGSAEDGVQFVREGDMTIEKESGYYAVTFPHLAVAGDGGERIELGIVSVNAAPVPGTERWKMSMALPTPITVQNEDGLMVGRIDLGGQFFSGVYDADLGFFTRMDARYGDIAVKDYEGSNEFSLGAMEIKADMQEDADGRLSGPTDFVMREISFDGPDFDEAFGIDEILVKTNIGRLDVEAFIHHKARIEAVEETAAEQEADISPEHAMGMYNLLFDYLGSIWDSFDTEFKIRGLKFSQPDMLEPGGGTVELESLSYSFGMGGFESGDIYMTLGSGYEGFEIDPAPSEVFALFPSQIDSRVRINNLPYEKLVELGRGAVKSGVENTPGSMGGLQAVMMLPMILSEAGTNLTIKDNTISSDMYTISADADFVADMEAVHSVSGTARVNVEGLGAVMKFVQEKIASGSEDAAKLQQAIPVLTILQMVGKKDESAGDALVYDFELNKQGQMLLNGADIMNLVAGGNPQAGPAAEPVEDNMTPEVPQPDPR